MKGLWLFVFELQDRGVQELSNARLGRTLRLLSNNRGKLRRQGKLHAQTARVVRSGFCISDTLDALGVQPAGNGNHQIAALHWRGAPRDAQLPGIEPGSLT